MISAIKRYGQKLSFPVFLLLMFFSCSPSEKEKTVPETGNGIIQVNLSYIGGSAGDYKIIKITKDSIHSEKGTTLNKTHKEWHAAISKETWKKLIALIDIKTLDDIKSSPSAQFVDGVDETFQIKTPKKSHVYVNAYKDTANYRPLYHFKTQLKKILPKEYQ